MPESGEIIYPVSVDEFKNYARITGFEDDGESGELPLNSDDSLIEMLIGAATDWAEKFTGLSLRPHTWYVRIENGTGEMSLPMSNGATVEAVLDCQGEVVDEPVIAGIDFKRITSPLADLSVTYSTAGYCPPGLKAAILTQALYRYENRGDNKDHGLVSELAITQAMPYRKNPIV